MEATMAMRQALLLSAAAVATAPVITAPSETDTRTPSLSPSAAPPADAPSFYLVYAAVYACGVLFLMPSGIAWMRMWRNRHIDATAVKLFSLLGLGALLRALAFVLVAVWMLFVAQSRGTAKEAKHLHLSYLELVFLWQLLGMFGSFVLGSVFLLVFNTWASMIEQVGGASSSSSAAAHGVAAFSTGLSRRASSPSSPPTRVLFIKMVVAIYVLQMVTFVVLQPSPTSVIRRSMYLVATVLLAFCFIVCMFLLPAYGRKMCALLDKVAEDATHRQRNIRRIAAIATVFCLMRTVSLLLLAASQYGNDADPQPHINASNDNDDDHVPAKVFDIPSRDLIEENPIFFFTASGGSSSTGLLR
ncbi:hypothetical protein Gpo141_00012497, partial [Globisporangium polare]